MKMNEVKLPDGWSMATLGDVADEAVERSGPVSSEFIYVDISSIDREQKCISDAKVLESTAAPSRAKQVLQSRDVLISMTRPNLNAIAMATPEFHGAISSTGFHVLRSKWVEPKFLFYLVHTREFIEKMCLCVQGALYPAVRPNDIASFSFSLPSRPEQHRIVAKIEQLFSELDKSIENLKTARAQLKVYRQALLKHAFEGKLTAQWRTENQDKLETADALLKRIQQERVRRYEQQLADWKARGGSKSKAPKPLPPLTADELADLRELPEGWGWIRVGEIADVQLGRQRSPNNRSNLFPTKYIRAGNLTDNGLDLKDVLDMEFEPQERARFLLKAGDVLLSEASGSAHQVGKPAVWRSEIEECCFQNTVIRVRSLDELSEYLFWVFKTYYITGVFSKLSGGVGINHLSAGKLESMAIPLVAIAESEKILALINEKLSLIENLDQTITTSLQQSEALRQSILKKAFSGQLVPQDPHDEPASKLLARIKAERAGVVPKPRKNTTGDKSSPVVRRTAFQK